MRRGMVTISTASFAQLQSFQLPSEQEQLAEKLQTAAAQPNPQGHTIELSEEELEVLLDLISPPSPQTQQCRQELTDSLLRLRA